MRYIAIAIVTLLGGCVAQLEATSQRWHQEWTDRQQGYELTLTGLQESLDTEWNDFQTTLVSSPNNETALSAHLDRLGDSVFIIAKTEAQSFVLKGYLERLQDKPTFGIVSSWITEQAQDVMELQQRYETNYDRYLVTYKTPDADYSNWIWDTEKLLRQSGAISGATDEILRISREFQSYAQETQEAARQDEVRRQRLAAALSAMGQSMQQYSYQQQQLYELRRPKTCTQFGNSITCY